MNLRSWLTDHNVSVADFAGRIGVTQTAAYRYVAGDRMPRPEVLRRIHAETAGEVTANDFLHPDNARAA